jgi:nucleoredoxin
VILDSRGNTITTEGRAAVMQPEKFPWIPPTMKELLTGPFVGADGSTVPAADVAGKTIALYFSAHWCGPCRGFTPQLAKTYEKMRARGVDNFEIIFVSSDRDQSSFDEYHKSMPWLALPFDQRDAKADLSTKFKVQGIPTLVVLGPEGANGDREVINSDGRSALGNDPEGLKFPWRPSPVPALEDSSGINDTPTVVVLADGATEETAEAIRSSLTPAAEKARAADGDNAISYAVAAPGDGVAGRVRSLFDLGDATETPVVILVDLGDSGAWYRGKSDEADAAVAAAALVEGFTAGTLERLQLS